MVEVEAPVHNSPFSPILNSLPVVPAQPQGIGQGRFVPVPVSLVISRPTTWGSFVPGEVTKYQYLLPVAHTSLIDLYSDEILAETGLKRAHRIAEERNVIFGASAEEYLEGYGLGPRVGGRDTQPYNDVGTSFYERRDLHYNGLLSWILAFEGLGSTVTRYEGVVTQDTIFRFFGDLYRNSECDPDVLYMNSLDRKDLSATYQVPGYEGGGFGVSYIMNRVTGSDVRIVAHPYLSRGVAIAACTMLPHWYAYDDIPAPAAILEAPTSGLFKMDGYMDSRRDLLLAVYLPGCFGLLTNRGAA